MNRERYVHMATSILSFLATMFRGLHRQTLPVLTASISSSSSSTVDTVTEPCLPWFFTCFVMITCNCAINLFFHNLINYKISCSKNANRQKFLLNVFFSSLQSQPVLIIQKDYSWKGFFWKTLALKNFNGMRWVWVVYLRFPVFCLVNKTFFLEIHIKNYQGMSSMPPNTTTLFSCE